MEKAKLLLLAPFEIMPPHFGSSERIYNIVKQLANDGRFELFVLYTDYAQVRNVKPHSEVWPNATLISVGPRQRWAQFFNPRFLLRALRIISIEKPALLFCNHLWAGIHAVILHLLTGIPVVLDEHNAEYIRFQRMKRKSASLIRLWEQVVCHFATNVIAVSEADRQHLMRLGVADAKITVIPNAIDMHQYYPDPNIRTQVYAELNLPLEQPYLLFFGKLDYQPNAEAINVLVTEIMPRILQVEPTVWFVVCGYNPPREQYRHPRLIFTGIVPRIEHYINASAGVIVPLISGGGTKFKIIQAIACGKPVITTTLGAEGIEDAGAWLQVSDDWETFSRLAIQLLRQSPLIPDDRLDNFRYQYSWEYMKNLLIQLLQHRLSLFERRV
ncbi:MAG: glycosyltransferase family 4 protein [Anaerolineae bacterium]